MSRWLGAFAICACAAQHDPASHVDAPVASSEAPTDTANVEAHDASSPAPYSVVITGLSAQPPHDEAPIAPPAGFRFDTATVSGTLPPEVVHRIVHLNLGRFRFCYQQGLRKDPALQGRVVLHFVIGRAGEVTRADIDPSSTLTNAEVGQCIIDAARAISFPQPEGGTVGVIYPLAFTPTR